MKRWILFLVIPVLTLSLLEFFSAVIFGGFFQVEPRGFWDGVRDFIVYFMVGVTVLHWAPNKNPVLAYSFSAMLSAVGFYFAIDTDGNVVRIMGETVVQQFSFFQEMIRMAGLFAGVAGAAKSEKDDRLAGAEDSSGH